MLANLQNLLIKYKPMRLSAIIAVLLILATLFEYAWKDVLPFNFTFIPLVISAGYVTYSTISAMIHLKKITAGVLVVLALIGTTIVGEYLGGAVVAFMMIFGEQLEDLTMKRTRNAVRELIKLVPDIIHRKVNGEFVDCPIGDSTVGDTLLVKPGERIPVDGHIISGHAAINESSITGESMPVDKTVDDNVFVGTLNENGVLEILADKIGNDTVLGKIIRTVHDAQSRKGPAQRIADRFAGYFVPGILLICLGVWFLTDDFLRVVTVLVIACPCALVLATPTAVVASVGNAAKRGVLIKGGVIVETTAKVDVVCFDKTGTITEGRPEVQAMATVPGIDEGEMLRIAAIAEKNSQHPIARAVLLKAEQMGVDHIPTPDDFEILHGRGIRVVWENDTIEVSNRKLENELSNADGDMQQFLDKQESMGRTALIVARNGKMLGAMSIADTVRSNSRETVQRLKDLGIKEICMLTGDNEQTAATIAEMTGIDTYKAKLMPEDKLEVIREYQRKGHKVAMVGDGINDAPALVVADIGIAMGVAGTDVAIESADIALMSDNLAMLPNTFALTRRTYFIIKQNIVLFAVLVNVVGIGLSGMGFLNPILAAVIHNVSSIFVVLNSGRLLAYRYKK